MVNQYVTDNGNPISKLVEPSEIHNTEINQYNLFKYFTRLTNNLKPATRIERVTYGLRNHCSTTELRRHFQLSYREV